ncbi:hypothetical protein [Jiangella sp. DSM 45060]|uniref:hypothetical protein n=1 Tax=Jiangella sp. DSM 45060 TaxID=1798224 RepID=UPI00087BA695|nr:hypothetical protein [Jiangella sp. DSM 45060]SDT61065.1 hypothetical protein SAMN04515669_5095 [Jiangella sp. DSM 45060]
MTETREPVPQDDSAWPAGALLISMVAGLAMSGVAVGLVVAMSGDGPVLFGLVLGGTVVAAAGGWAFMTRAQRDRLGGGGSKRRFQWIELAAIGVFLAAVFADQQAGFALICGFLGPAMLANARMVRVARANRLLVARANPVDDGVRLASPEPAFRPQHAAPPPPRPAIGQLLHDAVAVRQRRWIAWLVAAAVSIPAAAALGAWDEAIGLMSVLAVVAVSVSLLRVWPASRSRRRFARGDAPPRRAFVVVPFDAFPHLKPMLAIWTRQPTLSEGRLAPPERTYRIDPRHDGLVGDQADLEVHEAWVDTSSRRPRWVLADAGLAVPRRWSAFGRFYLFSNAARVALPHWLTVAAPHPSTEPVADARFAWGRFGIALAQRLAVFVVLALIFSTE